MENISTSNTIKTEQKMINIVADAAAAADKY